MLEVIDASYSYWETRALRGASLSVRPGERVVLLGRNGSGKSTLGRLLNGSLLPDEGRVVTDGVVSSAATQRQLAELVGYVRQDPRNQIVSAQVADEVAFGPRNLGLTREEVLGRVDEALRTCGIEDLRDRLTSELSGGQQQLLALAGVLAMRPRYLVLDEAGSQLDEASRARVRSVVTTLEGRGVGVLEIAHGVEEVVGADRVVVLDGGEVAWSGTPDALLGDAEALERSGLAADPLARTLSAAVGRGWDASGPLEAGALAARLARADLPPAADPGRPPAARGEARHALALSAASLSYGSVPALAGATFGAAGLTIVLGAPGSGKTTAARLLSGILEPDSGSALLDGSAVRAGTVGLSFQRPEDQLFADTVLDDIAYGPRMAGLDQEGAARAARAAAERLGVGEELLDRSPFELSGGQMRRVALADVVAAAPGAYVLDEPTAGLDAASRLDVRRLARELVDEDGAAVAVITHDAAEWLEVADAAVLLSAGRVVAELPAAEVARDPGAFEEAGMAAPLMVRLRAALEGEASHA